MVVNGVKIHNRYHALGEQYGGKLSKWYSEKAMLHPDYACIQRKEMAGDWDHATSHAHYELLYIGIYQSITRLRYIDDIPNYRNRVVVAGDRISERLAQFITS